MIAIPKTIMTTTARERPSGVGVTLARNNHRVLLSLTIQWEQRLRAELDVNVNTERGESTWRISEVVGTGQCLRTVECLDGSGTCGAGPVCDKVIRL